MHAKPSQAKPYGSAVLLASLHTETAATPRVAIIALATRTKRLESRNLSFVYNTAIIQIRAAMETTKTVDTGRATL